MVGVGFQLLVLSLLLASSLMLYAAWQRRRHERISQRVLALAGVRAERDPAAAGRFSPLLRRAGYQPSFRLLLLPSAVMLAGIWPAGVGFGWAGVLVWLALWPLLLYALLLIQAHRRATRMTAQFPAFLDQVVRGLRTGNSLHGAMLTAIADTRPPLSDVLGAAERALRMGASLPEVFHDAAERYEVDAFRALAAGVEINVRHGGSPVSLLESIARLIRERDRWARELRALTGETRFSALVLAILPIGIGTYMMAMNPGYLLHMWDHDTGRWVLLGSLGWQAVGCLMLWRMVRSA